MGKEQELDERIKVKAEGESEKQRQVLAQQALRR